MAKPTPATIDRVRTASRALVRELGFLNRNLAGTDLSPSAVHAIVEIGIAGRMTAKDLSEILQLEKSTISRLVAHLIRRGDIAEKRSKEDERLKILSLSAKGKRTHAAITRYAEQQVSDALCKLSEPEQGNVADGISAYTRALGRNGAAIDAPPYTLRSGYTPGLMGRIIEMHSRYYHRKANFGLPFEARLARDMSEFLTRLDRPVNQIWHIRRQGAVLGSIAIDGEDLGGGTAHLRWFIVDDSLRGLGAGKRLLNAALAFCDTRHLRHIDLWTFKGLDAARALYERNGFELIEENKGNQWGKTMTEQLFRRTTA